MLRNGILAFNMSVCYHDKMIFQSLQLFLSVNKFFIKIIALFCACVIINVKDLFPFFTQVVL